MRRMLLLALVLTVVAACSKVSQENLAKVREGMSEQALKRFDKPALKGQ